MLVIQGFSHPRSQNLKRASENSRVVALDLKPVGGGGVVSRCHYNFLYILATSLNAQRTRSPHPAVGASKPWFCLIAPTLALEPAIEYEP